MLGDAGSKHHSGVCKPGMPQPEGLFCRYASVTAGSLDFLAWYSVDAWILGWVAGVERRRAPGSWAQAFTAREASMPQDLVESTKHRGQTPRGWLSWLREGWQLLNPAGEFGDDVGVL